MDNFLPREQVHQRQIRLEQGREVLPYVCQALRYPNTQPELKEFSANLCNLVLLKKGLRDATRQDLERLTQIEHQHTVACDVLFTYRMLEALFELGCLKNVTEALSKQDRTAFNKERTQKTTQWLNSLPEREAEILRKQATNAADLDRIEFLQILRTNFPAPSELYKLNTDGDDYENPLLEETLLLTKPRAKGSSSEKGVPIGDMTTQVIGLLRVGAYEKARRGELFGHEKKYIGLSDEDIHLMVDWTYRLLYKDTGRPFIATDSKNRPIRPMVWHEEGALMSILSEELKRLREDPHRTDWIMKVSECENAGMTVRQAFTTQASKQRE